MISSNVITKISEKESISWIAVEKDYFLTLLLEGISKIEDFRKILVFKGGTALRKICFKHYRYSEDLDFTLIKEVNEKEIRKYFEEVFAYLKKEHNADFTLKEIYSKEWFHDIKIQFIGLKGIKNTVTVNLMADEIVVDKVKEGIVLNKYYHTKISLPVYSIEEILAEKLRSILQRTRVRDYYDVWYLLKHVKDIRQNKLKEIFIKKVKYKKIDFKDKKQLFAQDKIEQARAYYQRQIAHQLRNHPSFDKMVKELEELIEKTDF